jgi:chromosome segregation ATPase
VQHDLDFSAHAALAAGLLRQQLRETIDAYDLLESRYQTCRTENAELFTQLSDLRVESDNLARAKAFALHQVVRVDDENVELSETVSPLRQALSESIENRNDMSNMYNFIQTTPSELQEQVEDIGRVNLHLRDENTHLAGSLTGTRHQLNETSRRNLELLKKQQEQAHSVMHSTSEMHESQERLAEAEKDIEDIHKRMHYVRLAYHTDLQLMLMHFTNMSPEQATLNAQEWLDGERNVMTHDIPMLSLIQHMKPSQPSTSQSSLGPAPTDPSLFLAYWTKGTHSCTPRPTSDKKPIQ